MKKEIAFPLISIFLLIGLIVSVIIIYNKQDDYIYKINYSDNSENKYEIFVQEDYTMRVKSMVECHNDKCQGNYDEPIITQYNLNEFEKENLKSLIKKLFKETEKEITITSFDLSEEDLTILNNLL